MENYRFFDHFFENNKANFFALFEFPPTDDKKQAFNDIMRRFLYYLRKPAGFVKDGECPFYQPSTQNKMIRMLLVSLKNKFGYMPWNLNKFNYTGGFGSVTKQLYKSRQKVFLVSCFFFVVF